MSRGTGYWSPIQTIPLAAAKLRNQMMIAMPPITTPATTTILNIAIAKVMAPDFFFLRTGVADRVRRERIRSNASSTSGSFSGNRDWAFSTIRRPAVVPETSDLAILELLHINSASTQTGLDARRNPTLVTLFKLIFINGRLIPRTRSSRTCAKGVFRPRRVQISPQFTGCVRQ